MKQNKKIHYNNFKDLKKSDFDGHTEFKSLTPEQKLLWISTSAQFWYMIHKEKGSSKKYD